MFRVVRWAVARVALFGDLSGHTVPLYPALEALGVDVAADRIPEDLVVVQVGDLVHKGPDGDEAVALVDRMMLANPGRWVSSSGTTKRSISQGPVSGRVTATRRASTRCDGGPGVGRYIWRWRWKAPSMAPFSLLTLG